MKHSQQQIKDKIKLEIMDLCNTVIFKQLKNNVGLYIHISCLTLFTSCNDFSSVNQFSSSTAYSCRAFWTYSGISAYFTNKTETADHKAYDITKGIINIFSAEVIRDKSPLRLQGMRATLLGGGT